MAKKVAGAGEMPAEKGREAPQEMKEVAIPAEAAMQPEPESGFEAHAEGAGEAQTGAGQGASAFEAHVETAGGGRQPDFRVVQPEYLESEGKTIFKDVGALWRNISRKTGREFYTMKIGKLKLLVFPNQKLEERQ